eukprot:6126711-Pyramimonas_sp.AAC.1
MRLRNARGMRRNEAVAPSGRPHWSRIWNPLLWGCGAREGCDKIKRPLCGRRPHWSRRWSSSGATGCLRGVSTSGGGAMRASSLEP